jgi:hypothetical protein
VELRANDSLRRLVLFLLEKAIWLLALPCQIEGLLQLALSPWMEISSVSFFHLVAAAVNRTWREEEENKERGIGGVAGLILMLHGGDEPTCGRAKEEEKGKEV